MRAIEAILWDLDGVIVQSGEYHYEAYRELFGELDVPFSREQYFDELFGIRNWAIIRTVAGERPKEEIERLAERKEETFRRIAKGKIEALPSAKETIKRARAAGLRQAIVSSTPGANIEMILGELELTEAFDAINGVEITCQCNIRRFAGPWRNRAWPRKHIYLARAPAEAPGFLACQ